MDAEGERRWRGANTPFDGVTISLSNYVTLAEMRPMLIAVVMLLHERFMESSLFTLHDWWQHDEYVTKAEPTCWQQLQSLLVSDAALTKASTGDFAVRTAFFPRGYDFYLRIYVHDEVLYTEDARQIFEGDFDVTCQEPLAVQIKDMLERLGTQIEMEPAKAFFDRRYSG